jgi:UDP-3-O-[3-hydroxymyristoyl] glucosamine N-acyltransferase
MIGGGVGIADHLIIGSDCAVAAGSGVGTNVASGTIVSGYPAMPHERSLRNFMFLGRQPALHKKVTDLQSRIEALEQEKRGSSEERNDD